MTGNHKVCQYVIRDAADAQTKPEISENVRCSGERDEMQSVHLPFLQIKAAWSFKKKNQIQIRLTKPNQLIHSVQFTLQSKRFDPEDVI